MRPEQVTEIFEPLGGCVIDAYGWSWGPLRVERGGGIAGNGALFWIRFPGEPDVEPLGPFTTQVQLRKAIRQIVVTSIRICTAIHDAREVVG